MDLPNLISVFVATHIIRADQDPYIENKMIVDTIRSAHDNLKLYNVEFYVYPDAAFNESHPELQKKYYEYLEGIKELEGFENIKINIVKDTR